MHAPVLWLFVAWVLGAAPGRDAATLVAEAGARCERGCLVSEDGWTYEFRRADVVWFAKALYCEAGRGIPGPEGEATAWTLVHRFYQTRDLWGSFHAFLDAYSQCIGSKWSSTGRRRTKRNITAQVDVVRAWTWEQIPIAGRWLAERFLAGLAPDAHPTWVHFLACGYERHRADGLIGPYYVGRSDGACNAHYEMRETQAWTSSVVVVVPAVVELPPMLAALHALWSARLDSWTVRVALPGGDE